MKQPTKPSKTATQRQVILWGRFSSEQQKDGDSERRQNDLNRATAKRLGVTVIPEHFDPASSVKDGATPLFKKVVSELPKDVGIICENLDRISRGHSWRTKSMLLDLIEDGHFIITSTDAKEYNQESIEELETVMVGDMKTALAREENNKRTKRVKEAKQSALELLRHGKAAPFGSNLPPHIKYNPETRQYDIVKDKLAVVKSIFEDYANGHGVQFIIQRLNKSGIKTFKRQLVNGWQKSTIFSMLRYEGFIGISNIKGERIIKAWQPAISEQLFYKVQSILKTNVAL